jgi:hypothetical protein
LRLDALGGVDHHDRAVDRGQGPVGVFREVLVAGRVEQVEEDSGPLEGHHRRGHRNPALLLDRHPVGTGSAAVAARPDLPGLVDRARGVEELFGQGRLAGVRMGDDREGAPLEGRLAHFKLRKVARPRG